MRIRQGAFTLLHGAIAVLAAGWLAGGSCSVAYSSCNHEPGDCSAPEHDRDCPCFEPASAAAGAPPRTIAYEVEVDALGRSRVRRWLVTERGPIALERGSADDVHASWPVPFKAP